MISIHHTGHHGSAISLRTLWVLPLFTLLSGCGSSPSPDNTDELIALGERIFFNETFKGNGRTCGTCHRAEDNFGLSPAFIATLPPDDSLRSFAVGAVIQHLTKTTRRIAGADFRLPNGRELDALEAYLLSLGRQQDLALPLPLAGQLPAEGQRIFLDNTQGKCNICHFNAGANADPAVFGADAGNLNFDTGIVGQPGNPARATGALVPRDDGFGTPGNGEFNTPPLVEAADTAPFFHDNSAATLEASVAFYNTDAFNNSPAGRMLVSVTGGPLALDSRQVAAVTAFLRVINVLENIRSSSELMRDAWAIAKQRRSGWSTLLARAGHETEDGFQVLRIGALHPEAMRHLQTAMDEIERAKSTSRRRDIRQHIGEALARSEQARSLILEQNDLARQ